MISDPHASSAGLPVPTLPQAINNAACAHPNRIALVDDFRSVTWAELLQECCDMVALLQKRSIKRLGIATGNEIGHLVAVIAAAAARIPAVPVAIDWTVDEIAKRFALAEVDLAVCSAEDMARLEQNLTVALLPSARETALAAGDPQGLKLLPGGSFDDIHLIAPTGGTSGRLKFAYLSHANTVARFVTQIIEFNLVRRGRFLCATPLFHGGGRSFSLCHLYLGGSVLLRQHFDSHQWLTDVNGCSAAFLVPTMALRIVEIAKQPIASDIRVIISGARLDVDVAARWQATVGGMAYNYYGSVEAGAIAVSRLSDMVESGVKNSLGMPAFGVQLELHSARLLPDGTTWSEGAIRGPAVALGLETELSGFEELSSINPGDLLSLSSEEELRFGGRADDVVISGGVNIYPSLVEEAFQRMDGLPRVVALGVPSAQWGEELVLAIEGPSEQFPGEGDLRAFAARELSRFSRPKRYCFMTRFPLTAAGKIDRRTLSAQLAERKSFFP
ncbi:class I adenylate-forming enzyme family protein [Microvirga antarctica]|uniref:class I adenylate-forming enzyme family protein n=1 Tax=Microvirga antarctica TaxID=2819233 RepID=UPI001B300D3C|nr:class I adenylate-forming enzyme family protein [Microvirga antarctica]